MSDVIRAARAHFVIELFCFHYQEWCIVSFIIAEMLIFSNHGAIIALSSSWCVMYPEGSIIWIWIQTCLFQFDIGIPSMTKCCNQHDRCYDTCGREKHDCDEQFQDCLETICRNVQRTLGLAQSVQGKTVSYEVGMLNVMQCLLVSLRGLAPGK